MENKLIAWLLDLKRSDHSTDSRLERAESTVTLSDSFCMHGNGDGKARKVSNLPVKQTSYDVPFAIAT